MKTMSTALKMFLNISYVQLNAIKKFDAGLNLHGISMTDFIVLYHLSNAVDEKLRRIDLAEKVGLTASGITRILSPLEKLGMVRREANHRDARVSYVKLAPAGKRTLNDTLQYAEEIASEISNKMKPSKIEDLFQALLDLGGNIR